MHKIFKNALRNAVGQTAHVVVVIADIRGFSSFSLRNESPEVATYIQHVYCRLIDEYFPFASFIKPTGDGLLITVEFTRETLQQVAQDSLKACLRCLKDFPDICKGDPMINFDVPSHIGFGLTRGTACCLISGDMILDYSGQILNLSSRLTELARPGGIVLDGAFGIELLTPEDQELFEPAEVYIRSLAEEDPRHVYILKGVVEVPEQAKHPLAFEQWDTVEVEKTLRQWEHAVPRFFLRLDNKLKRPDGIQLEVSHGAYKEGKRLPLRHYRSSKQFSYREPANQPQVVLHLDEIVARLREEGVPSRAKVLVSVAYVPERS